MSRLPNAPLQEVIFEVRWAMTPIRESGQVIDEGFDLATGRLSSIVEDDFLFYKRIIPQDLPEQLLHYNVVHQYWKDENKWPVLQLGPGIFTINSTEGAYEWNSFRQLISKALNWLFHSYRSPLNILFASLRYIDAIQVDNYGGLDMGWKGFIEKYFNLEYKNHFNTRGQQKQIQINQTFELEDGSDLQLQISDGLRRNQKALVWQTAVLKRYNFDNNSLISWVEDAHKIAHELFIEMIKPELYASFSREN